MNALDNEYFNITFFYHFVSTTCLPATNESNNFILPLWLQIYEAQLKLEN
jgi:hypothetical protein